MKKLKEKTMRPLKFRFWNKLAHRFQPPSKYAIQGDGQCIDYDYEMMAWDDPFDIEKSFIVAQQYTGLKDKNGVEIYEGDIVQQRHFDGWFDTEGFIFKGEVEFVSIKDDFDSYTAAWKVGRFFNLKSDCEVIGNIFENPELLN